MNSNILDVMRHVLILNTLCLVDGWTHSMRALKPLPVKIQGWFWFMLEGNKDLSPVPCCCINQHEELRSVTVKWMVKITRSGGKKN